MDYKNLQKELRNKERTVGDLARHCGTTPDNNPNYCLFLGAGCSVTSGIKSGGQQVEVWRKEVFEALFPETKYEVESAKQKLATDQSSWYDPRNEYSSLFEKRYDLPRQRRMFVESEVADKNPSIGYAYLIKLMESNFFNAIFTTNFDDLLNEAFYRFSDHRPISCAHDSAINSITVTSKRPKIIKLHGDFLFDDIKSTLKETESLENNMRNKFIEFSKDFGLIVVGYGGYDHSVIDVLTFLLKNEEYYKGGIYWCLRENDQIGTELHKLLWKDRVYYVKIDGFDELFAALNKNLQPNVLPLDTKVMTSKSQIILQNIEENMKYYSSTSSIIENDITTIKKRFKSENLKLLFRQDKDDKQEDEQYAKSEISVEKRVAYLDLKNLLERGDLKSFEKNLDEIKKMYGDDSDTDYHRDIKLLTAEFYSLKGEISKARSLYRNLYDNFGKHPDYLCSSAYLKDDEEGLALLSEAIERDNNHSPSYFLKGCIYATYHSEFFNNNKTYYFEKAVELFKTSIEKDPSIDNHAWIRYFLLVKNNAQPSDFPEKCNQLLNEASVQNDNSITVVKMNLIKIEYENKDDYKNKSLEYFDEVLTRAYGRNKYLLLKEQLRWMIAEKEMKEFDEKLIFFKEEYNADNDSTIIKVEAKYYAEVKNDIVRAIEILEEWTKNNASSSVSHLLFDYYLNNEQLDDARKLLKKYFPKNLQIEFDLMSAEKKYEKIINKIDGLESEEKKNFIIEKTICLMRIDRYKDAQAHLKIVLDDNNWEDPLLIINYELCNFSLKSKPNKERLQKQLNHGPTDSLKLGLYILLKKMEDAKIILYRIIANDYVYRRKLLKMPIFDLPHCSELRTVLSKLEDTKN